jgi:hypothetical protein
MSYRDEAGAARARLAALELQLLQRKLSRPMLVKYRNALRDEWTRLGHALTWYVNGERYGFNQFRAREDLSPALAAPLGLPTVGKVADSLAGLDARDVMNRAQAVERALAEADPSLEELRGEVERLRAACTELRVQVEAYQQRYPDRPPPPEYKVGRALAIVGASCGAVVALLAFLASL